MVTRFPKGMGPALVWLIIISTTILVAPPLLTRALSRTHRFSNWRAARPLRGSTGSVRRARPPGARELPSKCGLWIRSITCGGGLGGGTVATLVGASGGGFLGGARLAVTPLLGGPAGGALGSALPEPQNLDATGLKSLEFRSRAKNGLCSWKSGYHLFGKDDPFQRRSPTDL